MDRKIREFRIKAKFVKTFGRIFAIALPSFFAFIWGGIALFIKKLGSNQKTSSDLYSNFPPLPSFEDLITYGFIIIIISLLFSSVYTYIKYKSKKIEFYDSFIEIKQKKYLLNNLILINRPTDEMRSYGKDFITLKFSDGKKLKFDKAMPHYSELRRFLKKYLYDRVDYSKLLNGAEF